MFILVKEEEYDKIEAISIKTFFSSDWMYVVGLLFLCHLSLPMFVEPSLFDPHSFVLIIITNHYINPRPNINTIHNVNEYTSELFMIVLKLYQSDQI